MYIEKTIFLQIFRHITIATTFNHPNVEFNWNRHSKDLSHFLLSFTFVNFKTHIFTNLSLFTEKKPLQYFFFIKGVYSLRQMLPVYCQIIKYEQEQTIKQNKQTKTELHGEGQNNQRENDGES